MNSKQRRKRRRALGARPPYACFWCRASLYRFDGPCECAVPLAHPRRLLGDARIRDMFGQAYRLGLEVRFHFEPNNPLEQLASLAEKETSEPIDTRPLTA